MRVHRVRHADYFAENMSFNSAVQVYVQEAFQAERIGPEQYLESPNGARPSEACNSPVVGAACEIREALPPPDREPADHGPEVDWRTWGNSERILASAILNTTHATIVLVGAMGCGKTALSTEVLRRLRSLSHGCRNCRSCDPIHLELNFNRGFRGSNPDKIVETFHRKAFSMLRPKLKSLLVAKGLIDDLVTAMRTDPDTFCEFDSFLERVEEDCAWRERSPRAKVARLLAYVEDVSGDFEERLALLAVPMRFVVQSLGLQRGCFVVFYDNIDRLLPEAQYDILDSILAFQETAQVRALVPLRATSFENLNRPGLQSYEFGVIRHQGPPPIEVCRRRMAMLRDGHVRCSTGVHHAIVAMVQERARSISSYPRDSRAVRALEEMSGFSIRRALGLCRRWFLNAVIRYDNTAPNQGDLCRALLVAVDREAMLDKRDVLVSNVFVSMDDGSFSLLSVRILMFVRYRDYKKQDCFLRELITFLRAIGKWRYETIRLHLNYLMSYGKKLIWMDARHAFGSTQEMLHAQGQRVRITETGRGYLRWLIRDASYLQEVFVAVGWDDECGLPARVDYGTIVERLATLRKVVNEVRRVDEGEIRRYVRVKRSVAIKPAELMVVSRNIAVGISDAVVRIMRSSPGSGYRWTEEARDWYSLLLSCSELQRRNGRTDDRRLAGLMGEFKALGAHDGAE